LLQSLESTSIDFSTLTARKDQHVGRADPQDLARQTKIVSSFLALPLFAYIAAVLAVVGIQSPDVDGLLLRENDHEGLAIKMNYVRLPTLCFGLALLPILLWTSVRYALNLIRFYAAFVAFNYIDDHLVLYDVIQYPDAPVVQLALSMRPFAIMALLWMAFELQFRIKNGY
jgi:hypothetical protein